MLPTHYLKFFLSLAFVVTYSSYVFAEGGPTSGGGAEHTYANTPYGYNSSSYSSSSNSSSSSTTLVRG